MNLQREVQAKQPGTWAIGKATVGDGAWLGLRCSHRGANGLALADIVNARIFLVEPRRDDRGFERSWRRISEPTGHLPSMNLIPSKQANGLGGIMMHELIIEIDLIGHKGHGS